MTPEQAVAEMKMVLAEAGYPDALVWPYKNPRMTIPCTVSKRVPDEVMWRAFSLIALHHGVGPLSCLDCFKKAKGFDCDHLDRMTA